MNKKIKALFIKINGTFLEEQETIPLFLIYGYEK